MLKRGKKGLSTIVATLIIILLVLVAVGIIWVVIRNVIQDGAEQVSLGKFTLDLKIEQVQIINDNQVNIKVKRNAGAGDFVSLKFIIEDSAGSEVIELNSSLKELEERIFNINLFWENAPWLDHNSFSLKYQNTNWVRVPSKIDLCLDTGHLMLGCKNKKIFYRVLNDLLTKRGDQIKFLHLHENNFKSDDHIQVPGRVLTKTIIKSLTKRRNFIFEKSW